ncbi:substrate-binding domain-containing protein [Desulfovibrio sp. JC022]|nr:substrate-binding domain-containing protein [Desulfovibrio sp. JC022]
MLCSPCASHAQKTIVAIPKATILNFWKIVCTGAHEAAKGQDINLIWRGPRVENKSKAQQYLLEYYTEQNVDAIVIAPADKTALNKHIDKAVDAGIIVVVIDSPTTTDSPHSYIATNNYKAGEQGAELLLQNVTTKGPLLLIGHAATNGATFLRENGFINKTSELSPGRTIIRLHIKDGSERATRIATEEILKTMPNIAGIFAVNEPTSDGMLNILEKQVELNIPFVGFDYNKRLLQGIKENKIQALITQKPYAMGYFGVKAAIDLLNGKKNPKQMESPTTTIITKDNLELSLSLRCLRKLSEEEKSNCPICFN